MSASQDHLPHQRRTGPQAERPFATTRWSIVVAARRSSPDGRQALATLCEAYWYPLYAYVRRRGYDAHEAQDLTQQFFLQLLENEKLKVADRKRGRFRSFLLTALKRFLANQWRDAHAQKRGGFTPPLSLDFQAGENRYSLEPTDPWTAQKVFERRWALTLLEQTLVRLREDFQQAGKSDQFEHLKVYLGGSATAARYAEVAGVLGMSEAAVKVAVHRLREKCRRLLRQEIAQTVATEEEIDQELRDLFAALGS